MTLLDFEYTIISYDHVIKMKYLPVIISYNLTDVSLTNRKYLSPYLKAF